MWRSQWLALGKTARSALLILAVLAFTLAFQGSRGLWERDEGRYTGVALQMMRSGDYLVPAYNDEVLHLTKPPLTYWSIAGGLALLGQNEWGARLSSALAFAATIFVLLGLARRITPDRPWLPPLVYATSILPSAAANIVTTDTLLALWEALAVLGYVEWRSRGEERPRIGPILLMWAAFGLAFLTKGPPGLLPLMAIVAFTGLEGGWRGLRRVFHPIGLLVFILLGFSWYVAVEAVRPGTLSYWLHDEVVARVASDLHHRNAQWYKAFTIYVPVFLIGSLPWIVPLFRGCRRFFKNLFSRLAWKERLQSDPWAIFLLLWFFLPLTVFLLSSSRLPLYVLPLAAPLALGIARWVVLPWRRNVEVALLAVWVVFLLVMRFVGAVVHSPRDTRALARAVITTIQPRPEQILFVDTKPYWGMNLYIPCEVKRIDSNPEAFDREEGSEPFDGEMKQDVPGRLMIVEKRRVDRIQEACRAMGYETHVAGGYASWRFIPLPPRKATSGN